ncbi:MAG: hypothetical protein OQK48_03305 [Sulfurimonas sp.]|uniref:hypothetical protein n=1 Tax=Sulfurimonas sp. TaxID=2022749 RepID=UPI0026337B61|nr:hypothetical protein [Sulfurimonas sp.]MCW8894848.1 hypothetical protein [Sulfurimonas sp.]MCW8953948.1 hypothetical protein [Sulfurimonas sp.]MCW9067691.1 hypothetical protein [Sulfurimonas sp.]
MQNDLFLKTGLTQRLTVTALLEKLKPSLDYLTYNVKRYKVPVALVLFYTEEDVSKHLRECMRLTDALLSVKIGDSYFNFIYLPFTEEANAYSFIKHIERNKLQDIKNLYYFENLKNAIYNHYNFINSYLFEIAQNDKEPA